ncbi:MAG: TIGR01841 family phasin [Paracoccaceae bacterium]
MTNKFPFAFDLNAMTEAFKMPEMETFFGKGMPGFDFGAMQEAQTKNMAALVEANKIAVSGYQALYKRQSQMVEAAMADAKDTMSALQGKPMSVESASENMETLKTAFEKTLADINEVAGMAQAANTDAFEVLKTRTEEALSEIKAATDKMAA